MDCYRCHRPITHGDTYGLNKKLVNRAVERYMCLSCLAHEFGESEESLIALADRLREQGCTLFPPRKPMATPTQTP